MVLHWASFHYQRAYCMLAVGGGGCPRVLPYPGELPGKDPAVTLPPGSAVQPVRGRHTTASPSLPRVRVSTV